MYNLCAQNVHVPKMYTQDVPKMYTQDVPKMYTQDVLKMYGYHLTVVHQCLNHLLTEPLDTACYYIFQARMEVDELTLP